MNRIDKVYNALVDICKKQQHKSGNIKGVSANEIAAILDIQRTNASSDLNKLHKEGRIEKTEGKPVLYKISNVMNVKSSGEGSEDEDDIFKKVIGAELSLKNAVQQARAAMIYPPNGLHTLLLGETGTGKSMFAETMYEYARSIGRVDSKAPFITFNCADYANNPQLLMSQLFGVKKGAYTGADKDRAGLVEKANGGMLFLDEIHRLPPEGQEMLFYLIDKGMYRNLGESESTHTANVLIICATTENVETALLRTFTRRVPMVIKLPALRDRTVEERFQIIKYFFRVEASVLNSKIAVTANTLKAMLSYECTNNIGQLKSDIKLCCARAYLSYMTNKDRGVCIHSEDLPEYVRKGLFRYKEFKDKIDKYITGDIITFSVSEADHDIIPDKRSLNLYEMLEEKRRGLEERGVEESDIELIMSLDIETYLKKYMSTIQDKNLEELYKVVDKKVVDIVDSFLEDAGRRLNKRYSERVLFGLAIHVASSIERLSSGKEIKNHHLPEVKREYKEEFKVASELAARIEQNFNIKVPEDEIGFVTMFLCLYNEDKNDDELVGVIVAMHGDSAATSIADVANRLLGNEHVIGYNMPLSEKPQSALEKLISIVRRINSRKGIILLVDMGSLAWFGDSIYEATGVMVKTVEMVSTPMVLEASRKAQLKASLEEVYDSVVNLSPYIGRIYKEKPEFKGGIKENIIITACITGEGTAVKLRSILEKKLSLKERGIDVFPIDIESREDYKKKLDKIKEEKNILAVVSAVNPEDKSLLYISTTDLFGGNSLSVLDEKISSVKNLEMINNMEEIIGEHVSIDPQEYAKVFRLFYNNLINTGLKLDCDQVSGLMLHLACVLERVLNGEKMIHIKSREVLIKNNKDKILLIKDAVKPVESSFNVEITDEDCINIAKIVYSL